MGKWDGIKSQKIIDALQNFSQSLAADLDPGAPVTLTHENVVNGVSAALGDGVLTPSELKDLRIVADMTMTGRSFLMLRYLIEQTPKIVGAEGLFSLTTAGERRGGQHLRLSEESRPRFLPTSGSRPGGNRPAFEGRES
jgi:hypothetical protein